MQSPLYDDETTRCRIKQLQKQLLTADLSRLLVIVNENSVFEENQKLHSHNNSVEISFCSDNTQIGRKFGKLTMVRIVRGGIRHPLLPMELWSKNLSLQLNNAVVHYVNILEKIDLPVQNNFSQYGVELDAVIFYLNRFCANGNNTEQLEHCRYVLLTFLSALSLLMHPDRQFFKNRTVTAICNYIMNNYHRGDLTVAEIAGGVGLSPNYVQRVFFRETGQTPKEYLQNLRLTVAEKLVQGNNTYMVKEIAQMCGWNCPYYFSNCFRKRFGYYPSQKKNTGNPQS